MGIDRTTWSARLPWMGRNGQLHIAWETSPGRPESRIRCRNPSSIVPGSADRVPVAGGELPYGLGDGGEVLAKDLGVVARDLRAHLEVRVAGEHRIKRGPRLFHLP